MWRIHGHADDHDHHCLRPQHPGPAIHLYGQVFALADTVHFYQDALWHSCLHLADDEQQRQSSIGRERQLLFTIVHLSVTLPIVYNSERLLLIVVLLPPPVHGNHVVLAQLEVEPSAGLLVVNLVKVREEQVVVDFRR